MQITAAIKLLQAKCSQSATQVPAPKLKQFTEYFFSTFMAHYKLYQFVFTQPREDQTSTDTLIVETVESVDNLNTGKPHHIWDYEQKVKELDEAAERRQMELAAKASSAQLHKQENTSERLQSLENVEPPIEREVSNTPAYCAQHAFHIHFVSAMF